MKTAIEISESIMASPLIIASLINGGLNHEDVKFIIQFFYEVKQDDQDCKEYMTDRFVDQVYCHLIGMNVLCLN